MQTETCPSPRLVDGVGFLSDRLRKPRTTVLRWLREGRIPAPDVVLSRQERYWRVDKLQEFLGTHPV